LLIIVFAEPPQGSSLAVYRNKGVDPVLRIITILHAIFSALNLIAYILDWQPLVVKLLQRRTKSINVKENLKTWFNVTKKKLSDHDEELAEVLYSRTQTWLIFHSVYLLASILGIVHPYFLAANGFLAILSLQISQDVLEAIYLKASSLLTALLLGFTTMYVYSIIGFVLMRSNRYGFSNGHPPWNVSFWRTFLGHLDLGLQSSPVPDPAIYEGASVGETIGVAIFDTSWTFLIVLIMLAIVTGLIIDQYGEVRDAKKSVQEDLEAKCFVCSLKRESFDKFSPGYQFHIQFEHNLSDYINYFTLLQRTPFLDMNVVQKFSLKKFNAGDHLSLMPIKRSLSIETHEAEDAKGDNDVLNDKVDALTTVVQKIHEHVTHVAHHK